MTWLLVDRLRANAAADPDGVALRDGDRVVTWAALAGMGVAIARRLRERGVKPGDRVAFMAAPATDAIATLVGCLEAGAVAMPVSQSLTAREMEVALDVLAPKVVFAVQGEWTERPAHAPADAPGEPVDPEAPAVVVLTSGTTGRPKGVVLSHRAMAASADAWLGALPAPTGWAMPLGIAHVAGLGIVWRAARDRVPTWILPPADPDALLAAFRAERGPSHASVVTRQLERLLDAAGDAPAPIGVRALIPGGGPIPAALVVRAADAGWPVFPTYGLSEMASGVTALPAEEALEAPSSAGRPLPGMSVAIDAPGSDGVGEIVVRGPSRSSGYLGEPPVAATEPVRTGDMGRFDEVGRLVVVDRRTDRIVRGGENVDPSEVEAVLEAHEAVAEAAVVGRPDATWGHVPVAAVVLREGAPVDAIDALDAHTRASVAGFKAPVAYTRLDALPRTGNGKLRRDAVRAFLGGERSGELARPDGDAIGWRVTGDGPRTVVLLHGTLSTAQQLDRLAGALAAGGDVTVHALDRRGAGTSRLATPGVIDVATHVADLVAYLDARGIDRASLVGVSFGGVLALETAARRPDRVDAVVAFEPPYGLVADPGTLAWFHRVAADTAAAHASGGRGAAAETFLRHVAGDAAWERLPDRARRFLADEGDGALADSALRGLDPGGLARIVAPVLLLTGSASEPFYAPVVDELARRMATASRETLDGLRHTSPITDPAPVAAAVLAFLAGRPATLETPA